MRRRPRLGRGLAILALGLLPGFFSRAGLAQEADRAPREGEKAPAFEIQGFTSGSLLGKKNLLLVFYLGHF